MNTLDKSYLIINGLVLGLLGYYFDNHLLVIPAATTFIIGMSIKRGK